MANVAFDNTRDYQIAQDLLGNLYIVQDGNWFSQKTQVPTILIPNGWKYIPKGCSALAPGIQPNILAQSGIPIILPSSGSIGNNGALSGITALATTYSNGCWMYFPAGAIFAGSVAGVYWVVMSGTTTGTIYQNTIPTGQPTAPATPLPWVTTGPGAYTQTTASFITVLTVPVPGASIGPYGRLRALFIFSNNNSAGAKTGQFSFGGTGIAGASNTTNQSAPAEHQIFNRGVTNAQVCQPGSGYVVAAAAPVLMANDTTQTVNMAYQLELATATDYCQFDTVLLEAYA
jgi:hypothetical protein